MLLSHSAGMCYDWSGGDDMKKWCQQNGGGDYSTSKNSFNQPLIYEPGTEYRYSISIDWAGRCQLEGTPRSSANGFPLSDFRLPRRTSIWEELGGLLYRESSLAISFSPISYPCYCCQEHIFRPCDMASTTFYPKPEITSRQFKPCTMDPATGELKVMQESPLGKPTKVEDVKVLSGFVLLLNATRGAG